MAKEIKDMLIEIKNDGLEIDIRLAVLKIFRKYAVSDEEGLQILKKLCADMEKHLALNK
jgi:hypothetical protein